MIRYLLDSHAYDAVWLLPVYRHAFGKTLAPFFKRIEWLDVLCKKFNSPKLRIEKIEKNLEREKSYTIDTVEALEKTHPHIKFTLVIGSDVKKDLPRWHRIEELKQKIKFHFIPRAGFEDSPFPDVSSSQVRDAIQRGDDLSGLVPEEIIPLIHKEDFDK